MKDTKQVIVIRKDLKMRRGKEIAQGAHAAMSFLTRRRIPSFSDAETLWMETSFRKVCLYVNSEAELVDLHRAALDAGLESHLIIDSGKTEFDGVPTKTCIAIGPDYDERIDKITGHLPLY